MSANIYGYCSFNSENRTVTPFLESICAEKKEKFYQSIFNIGRCNIVLECCGLGVVENISTFRNSESFVILFGYFKLGNENSIFANKNPAEKIFELYLSNGIEFPRHLNGAFLAILWDGVKSQFILANDRFGLIPLFYFFNENSLWFSDSIFLVKEAIGLALDRDELAWAEFLTLGYVLGNKTFFKGLFQFPPASILTGRQGDIRITNYWEYSLIQRQKNHKSDEELIPKEINARLQKAISWMLPSHKVSIIPLSGGLDSRTLLCHSINLKKQIKTYTFGVTDSYDFILANKVASILGTNHTILKFDENYLVNNLFDIFYETNGLLKVFDTGIFGVRDQIPMLGEVLVTGLSGDSIFGSFMDRELFECEDKEFESMLFKKMSIGLIDDDLMLLLGNTFKDILDIAFKSFKAELNKFQGDRAFLIDYMNIYHRQRRCVFNVLRLIGNRTLFVAPFYDYELFDYAMSLPLSCRHNEKAYVSAFCRAFPRLAQTPWERTGKPLVPSIKPIKLPSNKRKFLDVDSWSRTSWRSIIVKFLLDSNFFTSTQLRANGVEEIVLRHLSSSDNYTEVLSILLTLALWEACIWKR